LPFPALNLGHAKLAEVATASTLKADRASRHAASFVQEEAVLADMANIHVAGAVEAVVVRAVLFLADIAKVSLALGLEAFWATVHAGGGGCKQEAAVLAALANSWRGVALAAMAIQATLDTIAGASKGACADFAEKGPRAGILTGAVLEEIPAVLAPRADLGVSSALEAVVIQAALDALADVAKIASAHFTEPRLGAAIQAGAVPSKKKPAVLATQANCDVAGAVKAVVVDAGRFCSGRGAGSCS
jgi:hypothetical protein